MRRVLGANLVEWGCIAGSGNGDRNKKDVVDVGVIIEERLREVATRCHEREYGAVRNNAGMFVVVARHVCACVHRLFILAVWVNRS